MTAAMIVRVRQAKETGIRVVPAPVVAARGVAGGAGASGTCSASASRSGAAGTDRRGEGVSERSVMVTPC